MLNVFIILSLFSTFPYSHLTHIYGDKVSIREAVIKPEYVEMVVDISVGRNNKLGRVMLRGRYRRGKGLWLYTYSFEPRDKFYSSGTYTIRWFYPEDGFTRYEIKDIDFDIEGLSISVPDTIKNPCVFIFDEFEPDGADVYLDDKSENLSNGMFFFEEGNYTLKIKDSGYITETYSINAERDDVYAGNVKLKTEKPKKPKYWGASSEENAQIWGLIIGGTIGYFIDLSSQQNPSSGDSLIALFRGGCIGDFIGWVIGKAIDETKYASEKKKVERENAVKKARYEQALRKWEEENSDRYGLSVKKW